MCCSTGHELRSRSRAPNAPASGGVVSFDEMRSLLLGVVADKTGYPAEMLSMGMELESDLGIDSIKRVEILSAMHDAVAVVAGGRHGGDGRVGHVGPRSSSTCTSRTGPCVRCGADASTSTDRVGADGLAPPMVGSAGTCSTSSRPPATADVEVAGLRAGRIAVTDDGHDVGTLLVQMLRDAGVDAELVTTVAHGVAGVVFLGGLQRFTDVDAAVAVEREGFGAARAVAGRRRCS